jgi:lysophospholipase L1-like esterase
MVSLLAAEVAVRLFVPVRLVGPALTVYDSVYNVRLKRNFRGIQANPEFRMSVSTNSLSFRGPEPDSFPSGGLLYLGDSFTVGYGVSDGEEFPALVRAMLHGSALGTLPYVNAGRSNSGNGHWVKFLKREGEHFAPKAVILQFSDNDIIDNEEDGLFDLSPRGGLVELPVPPAGLGRRAQVILERIPLLSGSYLLGLVREAFHAYSGNSARGAAVRHTVDWSSARPHADSLTAAMLREVGRICQQHAWPTVALLVSLDGAQDSTYRDLFAEYGIQSASVPAKTARPDLYYVMDGHLNPVGQRFAAEAVVELLKSSLPSAAISTGPQ